jgi:simple sugar transport system ATP-binding protein
MASVWIGRFHFLSPPRANRSNRGAPEQLESFAEQGATGDWSVNHGGTEPPVVDDVAPLLEVVGITKRFGATEALRGVSFALQRGESHALVGRNGAGKSTMVGVITGLIQPDAGEVRFDGKVAPPIAQRERWRSQVACVYQKPTVIPTMTVGENLYLNAYPGSDRGWVSWKTLRSDGESLLAEWGIDVDVETKVSQLTVGERQLVEIARALRLGTRFIVLDEPTAQLEAKEIEHLFTQMRRLQGAGVTFLYISHHLEEIYEVCHTVTVLRDGRHVITAPTTAMTKDDLVTAMVGSAVAGFTRATVAKAAMSPGAVLSVTGLTVEGWCRDVSFEVRAGECLGLAGLKGCGSTQVADAIVGLLTPEAGTIFVAGKELPTGRVDHAIESGVGYVPEDRHTRGFVGAMSVEENVTLTLLDRLGPLGLVSHATRRSVAEKTIESMDIVVSSPDQPVSELSGGNQQKTVIGRAMVTDPRVLVLIGPTAGVDIAAKQALLDLIRGSSELAVLMIADELDELSICDRVLVMFGGRIVKEFGFDWVDHELVAAMEGVQAGAVPGGPVA